METFTVAATVMSVLWLIPWVLYSGFWAYALTVCRTGAKS